MKKYFVFMVMLSLVSFSCKQRAVTQPETQQPSQEKSEKSETTQPQKTTEKITEQKVVSSVESAESAREQKGLEQKGLEEKEGMFRDVNFDYDKYDIKDEYKPVLKSLAVFMIKNSNARLSIEGHCDDRGTNEYNLALGDRRAKAAKDYLVSLGVLSSRIDTLSYGEEKPLCADQTEECWASNRRAHFVVLNKADKQ